MQTSVKCQKNLKERIKRLKYTSVESERNENATARNTDRCDTDDVRSFTLSMKRIVI